MLAQRVFTRSVASLTRGFQLQRRFIHPQLLSRPNTWIAKLRFRADGEPRSKEKSLINVFNCIIILNLCIWITRSKATDKINSMIINIQQTDLAYDSVNFDDPISTASYFTKLSSCLTDPEGKGHGLPEEEFDQWLRTLMKQNIKFTNKDGSTQSVEVRIHNVLRTAAEKVHDALRQYNRDLNRANVAESVVSAMGEALETILDVIKVCSHRDDSDPDWWILSA